MPPPALIDPHTQLALVREASRAPSVHNVQPARWRFVENGLQLLRAPGRELPVADPEGHDLHASLGAAWEGMAIALSRHGWTLGSPVPSQAMRTEGVVPVCDAPVVAGGEADPLAAQVERRRSHRGRFDAPRDDTLDRLRTLAAADAIVLDSATARDEVAALHDRATWHFESRPAYHAELWEWLRLTPRDPRWHRDGLNADCLALSRAERVGARLLLRPAVFGLLARTGAARALVSEAAQVRSAAGLVLFAPLRGTSSFDVGRRFYRLWLELTAAGLYASPMSASSDWDQSRRQIEHLGAIPAERRLANVLRVGEARVVAESPRLPCEEVLVKGVIADR